MALLVVTVVVVLGYVKPTVKYFRQSGAAERQRTELASLRSQHTDLRWRVKSLRDGRTTELNARRLGMVKAGEQPVVISHAPRSAVSQAP